MKISVVQLSQLPFKRIVFPYKSVFIFIIVPLLWKMTVLRPSLSDSSSETSYTAGNTWIKWVNYLYCIIWTAVIICDHSFIGVIFPLPIHQILVPVDFRIKLYVTLEITTPIFHRFQRNRNLKVSPLSYQRDFFSTVFPINKYYQN